MLDKEQNENSCSGAMLYVFPLLNEESFLYEILFPLIRFFGNDHRDGHDKRRVHDSPGPGTASRGNWKVRISEPAACEA